MAMGLVSFPEQVAFGVPFHDFQPQHTLSSILNFIPVPAAGRGDSEGPSGGALQGHSRMHMRVHKVTHPPQEASILATCARIPPCKSSRHPRVCARTQASCTVARTCQNTHVQHSFGLCHVQSAGLGCGGRRINRKVRGLSVSPRGGAAGRRVVRHWAWHCPSGPRAQGSLLSGSVMWLRGPAHSHPLHGGQVRPLRIWVLAFPAPSQFPPLMWGAAG